MFNGRNMEIEVFLNEMKQDSTTAANKRGTVPLFTWFLSVFLPMGDVDLVNTQCMMRYMYQAGMRQGDNNISEHRERTLMDLLEKVNKKRVEKTLQNLAQEKQKFASQEKVSIADVKMELERQEKERRKISDYFQGKLSKLSSVQRNGEKMEQRLRLDEPLIKSISKATKLTSGKTDKIQSESHNEADSFITSKLAEHARNEAAKRVQKSQRKVNTKKEMKPTPPAPRRIYPRPKVRDSIRLQFLQSLSGEQQHIAINLTETEKQKTAPETKKNKDTFAILFYKTHRCLFNAQQLEIADKCFKKILAVEDESEDKVRGSSLSKGSSSRRVLSIAQLHFCLAKYFPDDCTVVKRIYYAMCGRDTVARKEGVNFARFSTFLSTCFLGSWKNKMFLCFEILDSDRDGKLSLHDVFSLLKSDADVAMKEDFSFLMEWILKVNESKAAKEAYLFNEMKNQENPPADSADDEKSSGEKTRQAYEAIQLEYQSESSLDFREFRKIWPQQYIPQILKLMCQSFPEVGNLITTSEAKSPPYVQPEKSANILMSAVGVTKAKMGLLKNLRDRHVAHIPMKPNSNLNNNEIAEALQEAIKPGRFLRSLQLDLNTSRELRKCFDSLSTQGKMNRSTFLKTVSKAKLGFDSTNPTSKMLAERVFNMFGNDGCITYVEFLTLYSAMSHKKGFNEMSRMAFQVLSLSGNNDCISANEVDMLLGTLDYLDPVLSDSMMNYLVPKVTRGELASISKEHFYEIVQSSLSEREALLRAQPENEISHAELGSLNRRREFARKYENIAFPMFFKIAQSFI